MKKLQLKKTSFIRKRFLKTPPLKKPEEWLVELENLKEFIREKSNLQMVGTKIYFEITKKSELPRMMLEVIGTPVQEGLLAFKLGLELFDQEDSEVYVHKLSKIDLFSTDFRELIQTGRTFYRSIDKLLAGSESHFYETFRLVFDNEKIELHFFSQKDYIQKQL